MATQKLPVAVAAIVAILGAVGAVLHYLPATTSQVIDVLNGPKASFDGSVQQLEAGLKAPNPSILALRTSAAEAYRQAGQAWFGRATDWKCQVVDIFYNEMDPSVAEAVPLEAYSDYETSLLAPCSSHVFALATLDWGSFLDFKAQSQGSVERLEAIRHVVAQGTKAQTVGWAYLGERDAKGSFAVRYIHEAAAKVGDTVTTSSGSTNDGVLLHLFAPAMRAGAGDLALGGIAGFLPDGSRITILKLGSQVERRLGGPDAYLVFAEAQVVAVQPLLASALGSESMYMQRTRRVRSVVAMAGAAACPTYTQHNSLHGKTQLWVFAGESDNADRNGFLPGTSRLNTTCIPRDGQLVRATQDLRVFVGQDPHYPGVRPQGGVVVAGTEIRIVGDIAGYPFDATANPSFCNQIPVPQKNLVPVPAGHRKRYCVYVPFSPA
jgi:hypothetical protein